MIFPNSLSKKETKLGLIYWAVSLLALPALLGLLPLRDGQINFIYYCVNFAAVVFLLRRFLRDNLLTALDRVFPTLYYGVLSFLGYQLFTEVISIAIYLNFPEFYNVNDQTVTAMLRQDFALMLIGTVILVPVAEECFFRGIVFRNLYDRSPALAYIVSMAAFSAVHVVGYVGSFQPLQLLLCFLQYLPAGYCLCFAYRRSGTIFSPVLVHSVVNAVSVYNAMR